MTEEEPSGNVNPREYVLTTTTRGKHLLSNPKKTPRTEYEPPDTTVRRNYDLSKNTGDRQERMHHYSLGGQWGIRKLHL